MGRYYNGDIDGKFWFGVQSSEDADNFGGEKSEPQEIDYYFDTEHLPEIKSGIQKCLDVLGEDKSKLDKFFNKNPYYNDDMLIKETGIKPEEVRILLENYARLKLGQKILKCVEENGSCSFTAEL